MEELEGAAKLAQVLELSEVWKRYCHLAETADIDVPACFTSRRSSFKEKLKPYISNFFEFVVMHNQAVEDRQTLLVPTKYGHVPISKLIAEDEDAHTIPAYQPVDDLFLEMVHVAFKLRSEIMAQPPYEGFNISEDEAISCVPENLFMFLRLLFGGQGLLEGDLGETEDEVGNIEDKTEETKEEEISQGELKLQGIILSI